MIQPTFTVAEEQKKDGYAKLVLEPLAQGYGHTLGNALRRVMLSSLPGFAITSVKIQGVNHQFTTLEGLREDIVELVLNIKQIRLRSTVNSAVTLKIDVKGKSEVTAKDIEAPAGVEVVNKDLHLASLSDKTGLHVELTAEPGVGYSMESERRSSTIGIIPVDALFSPVVKVAYSIESTRVGRRTDFDKLVLQVWTNGTIEPKAALDEAAKILVAHFQQVYNPMIVEAVEEGKPVMAGQLGDAMKLTVEELDLPTRIANALRKGGYKTVEDLIKATRGEIAKVKNLGEKSVKTVEDGVNKKGFSLKD
ncbi:MAG TPA: DNA-directed RNA polymerase subunit alpha [Candidatus Pacebacteria bacterium]|nr:MAG: DNA-directed RNA polymerase subunit alpha [Microgenomates group bacterium GW2011_GWB1_45_17]KKU23679.1 MAG: DNA-directed RNA polymerase subunit alpha [Microgenomates group bacterium GW2011_GWA1_46_15]KKU24580.1 MAG: DNA-directed RNA polymerase subunit alpha [Microgenomates group bacterium GW2011_GWC1_46_15]HAV15274.1 DNA-directed RNA polymerase subunit alpha [Candidatus Paceibacterota bacterium]HCR92422.1 DNA-directed RNA polymerase subunit alpha [Candidatus Paceibacterota bacterium]